MDIHVSDDGAPLIKLWIHKFRKEPHNSIMIQLDITELSNYRVLSPLALHTHQRSSQQSLKKSLYDYAKDSHRMAFFNSTHDINLNLECSLSDRLRKSPDPFEGFNYLNKLLCKLAIAAMAKDSHMTVTWLPMW